MRKSRSNFGLAVAVLLALGTAGCMGSVAGSGSFDRTLTVTGPVRLDFENGAGNAQITTGPAGQVHVHGNFKVRAWPWENGGQRVTEVTKNPPIEQNQNLIRVGYERPQLNRLEVNYTIEVPADTEVHATSGSGNLHVSGINGVARLATGSGEIVAEQIGSDTEASTGSGDIHLIHVQGQVEANAGSGDINLSNIGNEVRITVGSGDVTLDRLGRAATVRTGSGDVRLTGASADLRVRTGSGDVTVDGNPVPGSYWEFRTGSGDIVLNVPQSAGVRFYVETHSGTIHSDLPLVVEQQSRRELRARIGNGGARVEVETGSGEIRIH